MLPVEWHGETLVLRADRTLYWPRRNTLILADTHFGKAATFRTAGVPVPAGTTSTDIARLEAAQRETGATNVVILGDFFHAAAGRLGVARQLSAWCADQRPESVVLVRGNHDRHAGDPDPEWGIICVDELASPPFLFRHDPTTVGDEPVTAPILGGHVHPGVVLRDVDGTRLRASCFLLGPRRGILPAFGRFTGLAVVRPLDGDRAYAIGGEDVVEATALARANRRRRRPV